MSEHVRRVFGGARSSWTAVLFRGRSRTRVCVGRCPGAIRRSRRRRSGLVHDEQLDGASTAETAGSRIASGAWRARGLDSRWLVVLRVDDVVGRILLEARGCALIPGRANRKEAAVYDAGLCKRRSLPEARGATRYAPIRAICIPATVILGL